MPDFTFERGVKGIACGIDEAGRGPLAGPVVAGAVILPEPLPAALTGLDDSKKLSAARREKLFDAILSHATVGIGRAEVEEIDALNILGATLLAMQRAYAALGIAAACALVDGNRPPRLSCPVRCVVGGDGLSLSIAAASIVAKVTRDREMKILARAFPGYGWERNAGYPTEDHRAAIMRLGATCHHRKSFAPVRAAILAQAEAQSSGGTIA
jgi:ribonuclease HII